MFIDNIVFESARLCFPSILHVKQILRMFHIEGILIINLFDCRNATDMNEQHNVEISSERAVAQDVAKSNEDVLQHVDGKCIAVLNVYL